MKKVIAVFLCMVMTIVMIPSFFASAATLPAQEVVVAADDSGTGDTGQVDNSLADPITLIKQFIELWGGLFKTIVGSEVWQEFLPALKKVLQLVSVGDLFKTIGQMFKDIRK
ncbi:MAG: hypothetical protein IJT44_08365 [Clostridia bacterium]|nr:hypothetical protein [Clostridia bacterium]